MLGFILMSLLALSGFVEGQDCQPSADAIAVVNEAAASAVGGSLSLAVAELNECVDPDKLRDSSGTPLAVALSLAITEGAEAIEKECEGAAEAAAEAVAEGVIKGVKKEIQKVKPEAEDLFESRSEELLADVGADLQARSIDDLEDTAPDRASLIAERVLEALQDVLQELNCKDTPPEKVKCRYIAGLYVGVDC